MPIEIIHPMLVHFPIVLVITALAFDLYGILRPSRSAASIPAFEIASILLIAGAMAAIVTAFFGDSAFDVALGRGFTDAQLETHQTLGIVTAIVLPILAVARAWIWWRKYNRQKTGAVVAVMLTLIAMIMVVTTAFFGGRLVYDLGVNVRPVAVKAGGI